MTEPKPTYETNLITEPVPTSATSYWQKVAEKERNKAADNLRLAAERASEIQELSEELKKEKNKSARLKAAMDKLMGQVYAWANASVGHTVPVELSDAYYKASLVSLGKEDSNDDWDG